ncbi:MAG: neutral zinc metallopeptidase [Actinomycetaceae bacterium]|nr:neutral zinc metallopeptidase [Actinomycetaceae bacterium]
MSFNENIRTSPGRASSGGRGGRGAAIGGGSALGLIALFVIYQFTGIDLTPVLDDQQAPPVETSQVGQGFEHCTDGAAANTYDDCRMIATAESLDAMWGDQLPEQAGVKYSQPGLVLFKQAVASGCGQASSATGPFYCPADRTVYMDTDFFGLLRSQFGAQAGPLAQEYVLAHEVGHHIQNQLGIFSTYDTREQGEQGAGVRSELQADCYAGIWMHYASTTIDPDTGVAFMEPPTDADIRDALEAAQVIGDDRIQARSQGRINPDTWTHGSSEQRMTWLKVGLDHGSLAKCDTFKAPGV